MKIYLICAAAIVLLSGCPEHTATDLDIVAHHPKPAQVQVATRGRSVHRPGVIRPSRTRSVDEPSHPRRPVEGQRLRPEPGRAPRA